ncbi:polysaccharide pyruvyl transferase family protein [Reyranella sp. CPCC 100927]|uniref:polysaccharide pyruvyl transferase family protein n=1 Tax=Reyranella sp. CPCC 100927 TaxID=2599616 RepID=UPI0011B5033B|nr:polysaccharide pyruvyl transferase family protein [Reyranella sp. CPCC 100927]TWT12608.1 polysaccharide pyruvyl transferase family protein [Reyranella sp. CPCC 100927]
MTQKRKLGVVGYYHYGNYGDELFLDVFNQYLGDFEFVFFQDALHRPYFHTPLKDKVQQVDAILIGGGDLVEPSYWTDQYFEPEFLAKPVYIHGVGVPTWGGEKQAIVARLATFFQHPSVKHIHVRDEQTRQWMIAKLGPSCDVQVTPDIVCALDMPTVDRPAGEPVFGLISRKQKPGSIQWSNVHALCTRAKAYGYRLRHIVLATGVIGREDRDAVAEFPFPDMEVVLSESIADLTRAIGECSVLASMKFHGCVVATMFGTPAITLITTDKFRNFYKLIEREELIAHHRHETLPDRLPRYMAKIPDVTRAAIKAQARDGLRGLAERIRADLGVN